VLADVERVLGGQLADMCFTDSPYNVDYAIHLGLGLEPQALAGDLVSSSWP
jgi:hypothetical protein